MVSVFCLAKVYSLGQLLFNADTPYMLDYNMEIL